MTAYVPIPGIDVVLEFEEDADIVAVALGQAIVTRRVMVVDNAPHGYAVVQIAAIGHVLVNQTWHGKGKLVRTSITALAQSDS